MAKRKAPKAGARKPSAKKAKGTRKRGKPAARKTAKRAARAGARKARTRRTGSKKAVQRNTTRAQGRKAGPTPRLKAGAKATNATNPWPTKPSTRTGAGAGVSRSPYLERERKRLREVEEEEGVPTPPSSLDLDRSASAVRTGRQELREALHEHTETSPALTGGDVDADWQGAYSVGDEAAGGDNPTPDQQRVDDIGKALGVEYQDNEELRGVEKIDDRDKKRWELDPASAEDYKDRQK